MKKLALGIVCLLGACARPPATLTVTPLAATPPINWGLLTPSRHLTFAPVTSAAGPPITQLGLSPASAQIPFYSAGDPGLTPGVYLADLPAHTVYQVPALGSATVPIAVSDSGHIVGLSVNGQLGVLDLRTQLIQVYPQLQNQFITSADVDSRGDIAYTDDFGVVHLLNPITGQDYIVPTAGRGVGPVGDISISGDGRFLSYTGLDATGTNVFTNDLATGQQLSSGFLNGVGGDVRNIQTSPDGRSLLYTEFGQLHVLDYATGVIDNLALLNNGYPVYDATFFNGDPSKIAFTRNGLFAIYDRRTGLIDTLPFLNQNLAPVAPFF
ncbi:MAG: hypothetical protein JWM80_538 [Cyanobacteria bacterium RYN_339]|nr:hypothetical protein [Cyanobacteria bacterium RYN_339]